MALAKNDVYARIELEQVTVQNVINFLLLFNCVADTASLFCFVFVFFVFAYFSIEQDTWRVEEKYIGSDLQE